MKPLHPAPTRSEPSPVVGVTFIDAAGKGCMWPLGGSGADMVVCGERRADGRSYCATHVGLGSGGGGGPVKRPMGA
jgi:hypothetical protein